MSYNSNLGYAGLNPYVGGQFVNSTNSQYAGNFGSNETQGGSVCNNSMMRGGGTKGKGMKWQDSVRRKIKNITRKYRKMAKKRSKSMRKRLRSRYSSKTKSKSRNFKGGYTYKSKSSRRSSGKKRQSGGQSGGYAQYGSNMPYPSSYSLGGTLAPALGGMASPPPFVANAAEVDNYNRFTNSGFSSPGN